MAYSITTKDGITIQNIPDDVKPDAPELRERVAKIRASNGALEAKPEGFGARLSREIEAVPRQLGLAARYAIQGPIKAVGAFAEPIRQGLNFAGANIQPAGASAEQIADMIGLPSPETPQERIVGDVSELGAGAGGLASLANLGSRAATGVTQKVLSQAAAKPTQQIIGAGSAGAAGGYTRETGGTPTAQFLASLVGGVAGAGAAAGIERGARALSGAANSLRTPKTSAAEVELRLERILQDNGVTLGQIAPNVRNQLLAEMRRALDVGDQLNPDAIRRMADYGAIGATPTRGRVTLDPAAVTQEKNLAKQGISSRDTRLQELGRIENRNNAALLERINEMGAGRAADPTAAGGQIIGALRAVDAPRKAAVDQAYQAVRDSSGRAANIDTNAFVQAANNALDEQMLGSVLPTQARSLLNDVATGKIPLNANTAIQLDSTLSGLARDAAARGEKSAALAIGRVRSALSQAPIESAAGNETRLLYDNARRMAAQRFAGIENNPALAAALDDVAPDKFINTFITSQGGKSNLRDVQALARDLRQSPDAMQAARQQIARHLKVKAIGEGVADETAKVSPSGFNKALDAIGTEKLRLFFSPDEVAQLRTIGRVASYETFQPRGSAVNNSNTASALSGLLERIASSPLVSRVPFGRAAIGEPAAAWSASIQSREALSPLRSLAQAQAEQGPAVRLPILTLPMLAQQPRD